MLIRIKNTTFGLVVNGIVRPKTPKDPPFEVDEELGSRLVSEGIAEMIGVSATATKQELIKALDDFFADALSDDPEGE